MFELVLKNETNLNEEMTIMTEPAGYKIMHRKVEILKYKYITINFVICCLIVENTVINIT